MRLLTLGVMSLVLLALAGCGGSGGGGGAAPAKYTEQEQTADLKNLNAKERDLGNYGMVFDTRIASQNGLTVTTTGFNALYYEQFWVTHNVQVQPDAVKALDAFITSAQAYLAKYDREYTMVFNDGHSEQVKLKKIVVDALKLKIESAQKTKARLLDMQDKSTKATAEALQKAEVQKQAELPEKPQTQQAPPAEVKPVTPAPLAAALDGTAALKSLEGKIAMKVVDATKFTQLLGHEHLYAQDGVVTSENKLGEETVYCWLDQTSAELQVKDQMSFKLINFKETAKSAKFAASSADASLKLNCHKQSSVTIRDVGTAFKGIASFETATTAKP